jgi:3',5'-cyclic AMP phosphodiesterase CpdA
MLESASAQQRINVAAVGDWGCDSNTKKTVSNINAKKPTLVLGLGDYSYQPTATCWLNTIKPVDKITKINIGNHEATPKQGLNQYLKHFGMSKEYYSFDHGNVHFLILATELPSKKGSDQFKFAENDLKKASSNTKTKWIVVTLHKQLYTSPNSCSSSTCKSNPSRIDTYHPLFDKYRVDLVLQGHIHNYQRTFPIMYDSKNPTKPIVTSKNPSSYTNPKGEVFVLIGVGGINFHGLTGKPSFVSKQEAIRFGALDFTITNSGKKLDAKFFGNDGSVRDSFTIQK